MASNIKPCVDHPSFVSHWAPNPSTERGDNLVLGTHPKEPKIIYPSGKFIVVRDVKDPTDVFVYRGHNSKTTVAKFSPNGFWVASADITGKVRMQHSSGRDRERVSLLCRSALFLCCIRSAVYRQQPC